MISILAAAAALVSSPFSQVPQPVQANPVPCLVVNGSSEVRVKPDLATLQAGITVQAKTAHDAQDQANRRIQDFLDKAKKLLGSKGTVETGAISLSPVYSEQVRPTDQPFTPAITAYRADDTISIRTTDFSLVGPVIDTAVASGLNNIQAVNFGLQDDTDARLQALGDAVKQARRKADAMARAAGIDILGIWEIDENGARVMPFQAQTMMAARAGGETPTPVEPGAVVVSGDVTIKFFIRPNKG